MAMEEYSSTWPWMNNIFGWKIKWMNFYKRWMRNLWEIMDEPLFYS
jgi:hypothetical protein